MLPFFGAAAVHQPRVAVMPCVMRSGMTGRRVFGIRPQSHLGVFSYVTVRLTANCRLLQRAEVQTMWPRR